MSKIAHKRLLVAAQRTDSRLYKVIKINGEITALKPSKKSLFCFMSKTLIGQQLSKTAADTIWTRFCNKAIQLDISILELCQFNYYETIRSCGVSNSKTKALILLQEAWDKSEISDKIMHNASYEEVSHAITNLWGFGQWSADMVAIFHLGLPDIYPKNDGAVNRGLQLLVASHTKQDDYRNFSPYRSFLARHVWKAIDSRMI